jgi:uncharacterized protein (DUF983 family)
MSERSAFTLWSRAMRLRCPRCGEGPLFIGWFRMHERCSTCHLKYERSPGYFLGSTYVNYGQTALTMTAAYLILHFGYGIPKEWVAPPLAAYCVLWPLFWFRYARALFLAFDCYFDLTDFAADDGSDSDESEI